MKKEITLMSLKKKFKREVGSVAFAARRHLVF